MLIWKQHAFKILVIGGPEGIIPKVENRIGKEINFPLDVQQFTFEQTVEIKNRLKEADLILVDQENQ